MNTNAYRDEERRVLDMEDEYVAAEVNRDEATLRRILDDLFVFNSNNGTTLGKSELIERILGWKMTGQTLSERTVMVDGDIAIIFGTTELRFATDGDEEETSRLRYTSVYKNRVEEWRFLALHMADRGIA
jgi:ketosteroid isomerase-like protein